MFIYLLILVFLHVGAGRLLRKKYVIERPESFFYKCVNRIHKWGEIIITVGSLVILFSYESIFSRPIQPHTFLLCIIALFTFRTVMEWIYNKESKHYILSGLDVIVSLAMYVGVDILL